MTNTVIFNPNTRLGQEPSLSVYDAILWCDKELGHNSYTLDNQFPSWRWEFKFNNPEDATHFALRWLH